MESWHSSLFLSGNLGILAVALSKSPSDGATRVTGGEITHWMAYLYYLYKDVILCSLALSHASSDYILLNIVLR